MPQNYRPGLDVVRLAALLPVLCYHYCIEAARLGFAVPTALIGRGMADWVEVGLAWFFLLSGAALCLQWQGRFDARRYFVGRAAATYPAFWLGFGGLVLRRVPGASCPADAGIPAVCAGARPAAGGDVPGVSRRQLCAGGGADGGKPPAWQGHKKAGIKIKDA